MPLVFRNAVPADEPLLRYWDTKPHVQAATGAEPGQDSDFNWAYELPRQVDWRELLIAEVDGRAIGFVQIIDAAREETHFWGDIGPNICAIDIWIGEEADLGKGYGTQMMQLAAARCFANPDVTAIVIDPLASNTDAIRFYRRLGYRLVEQKIFDDDESAVHRLDRADWKP